MLSAKELAGAAYGITRLLRRDKGAFAFFNASLEGFWRSFTAAAILAPVYAVLLLVDVAAGVSEQPLRFLSVQVIAYVMGWVAFPLLMVYLSRALRREENFFRYMVAYNWFQLVPLTAFVVLTLIATTGGGGPSVLAQFLALVLFIATLVYNWFIAREGLQVDGFSAIGVVFADFVLSLTIEGVTLSLSGAQLIQ